MQELLAIRLTAAVNERVGTALPPQALFDGPTIASLAELIVEEQLATLDPRELGVLLAGWTASFRSSA